MEHESFEDADIGRVLNEHFVSIKVDREERPDLDQIYMTAVQLLDQARAAGRCRSFSRPTCSPFYGGTYFPPRRLATAGRAFSTRADSPSPRPGRTSRDEVDASPPANITEHSASTDDRAGRRRAT